MTAQNAIADSGQLIIFVCRPFLTFCNSWSCAIGFRWSQNKRTFNVKSIVTSNAMNQLRVILSNKMQTSKWSYFALGEFRLSLGATFGDLQVRWRKPTEHCAVKICQLIPNNWLIDRHMCPSFAIHTRDETQRQSTQELSFVSHLQWQNRDMTFATLKPSEGEQWDNLFQELASWRD